mgnify:CR=1 FL=1
MLSTAVQWSNSPLLAVMSPSPPMNTKMQCATLMFLCDSGKYSSSVSLATSLKTCWNSWCISSKSPRTPNLRVYFLLYFRFNLPIMLDFKELSDLWISFCEEISFIEEKSAREKAISTFKNLFLELITICCDRARLSNEHLLFLNDNPDEKDDTIETFEYKNQ